jgi:hypothetical protein
VALFVERYAGQKAPATAGGQGGSQQTGSSGSK